MESENKRANKTKLKQAHKHRELTDGPEGWSVGRWAKKVREIKEVQTAIKSGSVMHSTENIVNIVITLYKDRWLLGLLW